MSWALNNKHAHVIMLRTVSSSGQSRPLTGFPSNHCSGMAGPRNEVIWGVKAAPLQHRHAIQPSATIMLLVLRQGGQFCVLPTCPRHML